MLFEGSESSKILQLTSMFAFNNYLPHGNVSTATGSEGSKNGILKCAVCFQVILEAFQYSVEVLPVSHILVLFSLSLD